MNFHLAFNIVSSVPLKNPNRQKWISAIEKIQPFDYYVATYHVCELHFLPEDVETKGKRKLIIPGRVPKVFQNIGNNNSSINLQVEDTSLSIMHGSNTICAGENQSLTNDATVSDAYFLRTEYLDGSDSNDYGYEPPLVPGTSTSAVPEDTILIQKVEYEKLLNEMVELAKLKLKVQKMGNALKEKSIEIKNLKRKVRYNLFRQEKKKSENMKSQSDCVTTEEDSDKLSDEVHKFRLLLYFIQLDIFNVEIFGDPQQNLKFVIR